MNPKTVSPKVWSGAVVAVVLGSLVSGLGAVTPGMLSFLGPWAPVAFAAVTAAGVLVSGYVVSDPVRAVGASALKFQQSITNPPAAPSTAHVVDAAPPAGVVDVQPPAAPVAAFKERRQL
jgi:hypothetical protein